MKKNQFENQPDTNENPNAGLENALENATTIDDICEAIENNLEAGYIDNLDNGHLYPTAEIIAAVRLAESEDTAEIPTLHKVPGLQAAVAEAIEETN